MGLPVLGRCSGCSERTVEWLGELWRRIKLEFTIEVRAPVRLQAGCARRPAPAAARR